MCPQDGFQLKREITRKKQTKLCVLKLFHGQRDYDARAMPDF
jgi:hypothetical protein